MRFPSSVLRLASTSKYIQLRAATTFYSATALSSSHQRPFSTSPLSFAALKLPSSAGSGQGGRKEKDQAKADKEALRKQKEQDKKDKEKAKLKEKRDKEKAKEREKKQKEKEKDKLQKAKLKEREKAKLLKANKPKAPRTRSLLHAPKAPVNAWGVYLARFIQERKEALPLDAKLPSVTLLTAEAAPLYKSLSDSEKAPLVEEAKRQRAEYPAILEAWKRSLTPDMIKEENAIRSRRRKLGLSKQKGIRLEGEPKKPLTGYMRFTAEIRNDLYGGVLRGETSILEQSKRIAEAWKLLSEEERETYNQQYAAAKEEYYKEKKAWDEAQAGRV